MSSANLTIVQIWGKKIIAELIKLIMKQLE